jgi:hypothetical protein
VQPIGRRLDEYVIDLFRCEGLRPAPGLAGRNVGQLHNIPLHLVPRYRPLDRSFKQARISCTVRVLWDRDSPASH